MLRPFHFRRAISASCSSTFPGCDFLSASAPLFAPSPIRRKVRRPFPVFVSESNERILDWRRVSCGHPGDLAGFAELAKPPEERRPRIPDERIAPRPANDRNVAGLEHWTIGNDRQECRAAPR